jgi:hypothetical protein
VPIGLAVTWSYMLVARKECRTRLSELVAFACPNLEAITFEVLIRRHVERCTAPIREAGVGAAREACL